MPFLTAQTFHRLRAAADGRDGAVLVGPDGRRQLAMVLDVARLDAVRPEPSRSSTTWRCTGCSAPLDLAEVPAEGREHRDVDTWADVRDLTS